MNGCALITGGSRGIGWSIAQAMARAGWPVALAARSADALRARVEELQAAGRAAAWVAEDLRDPAAPDRVLAAAREALGPVAVLVNNAGTAPSAKIEDTTDAQLAEVLDLHVAAPFRLARALVGEMRDRGGVLIQLASTAGLVGYPMVTGYTAAKHAMVGLTRALAVELAATPIRVHAVCPGFVDTDITRQAAREIAARGRHDEAAVLARYGALNACGRLIQPDEVARVVVELADPECAVRSGGIYTLDAMPPALIEA